MWNVESTHLHCYWLRGCRTIFCVLAVLLLSFNLRAATVEPPPDPGFEVSVLTCDLIACPKR